MGLMESMVNYVAYLRTSYPPLMIPALGADPKTLKDTLGFASNTPVIKVGKSSVIKTPLCSSIVLHTSSQRTSSTMYPNRSWKRWQCPWLESPPQQKRVVLICKEVCQSTIGIHTTEAQPQ